MPHVATPMGWRRLRPCAIIGFDEETPCRRLSFKRRPVSANFPRLNRCDTFNRSGIRSQSIQATFLYQRAICNLPKSGCDANERTLRPASPVFDVLVQLGLKDSDEGRTIMNEQCDAG